SLRQHCVDLRSVRRQLLRQRLQVRFGRRHHLPNRQGDSQREYPEQGYLSTAQREGMKQLEQPFHSLAATSQHPTSQPSGSTLAYSTSYSSEHVTDGAR